MHGARLSIIFFHLILNINQHKLKKGYLYSIQSISKFQPSCMIFRIQGVIIAYVFMLLPQQNQRIPPSPLPPPSTTVGGNCSKSYDCIPGLECNATSATCQCPKYDNP